MKVREPGFGNEQIKSSNVGSVSYKSVSVPRISNVGRELDRLGEEVQRFGDIYGKRKKLKDQQQLRLAEAEAGDSIDKLSQGIITGKVDTGGDIVGTFEKNSNEVFERLTGKSAPKDLEELTKSGKYSSQDIEVMIKLKQSTSSHITPGTISSYGSYVDENNKQLFLQEGGKVNEGITGDGVNDEALIKGTAELLATPVMNDTQDDSKMKGVFLQNQGTALAQKAGKSGSLYIVKNMDKLRDAIRADNRSEEEKQMNGMQGVLGDFLSTGSALEWKKSQQARIEDWFSNFGHKTGQPLSFFLEKFEREWQDQKKIMSIKKNSMDIDASKLKTLMRSSLDGDFDSEVNSPDRILEVGKKLASLQEDLNSGSSELPNGYSFTGAAKEALRENGKLGEEGELDSLKSTNDVIFTEDGVAAGFSVIKKFKTAGELKALSKKSVFPKGIDSKAGKKFIEKYTKDSEYARQVDANFLVMKGTDADGNEKITGLKYKSAIDAMIMTNDPDLERILSEAYGVGRPKLKAYETDLDEKVKESLYEKYGFRPGDSFAVKKRKRSQLDRDYDNGLITAEQYHDAVKYSEFPKAKKKTTSVWSKFPDYTKPIDTALASVRKLILKKMESRTKAGKNLEGIMQAEVVIFGAKQYMTALYNDIVVKKGIMTPEQFWSSQADRFLKEYAQRKVTYVVGGTQKTLILDADLSDKTKTSGGRSKPRSLYDSVLGGAPEAEEYAAGITRGNQQLIEKRQRQKDLMKFRPHHKLPLRQVLQRHITLTTELKSINNQKGLFGNKKKPKPHELNRAKEIASEIKELELEVVLKGQDRQAGMTAEQSFSQRKKNDKE